jgi:hypothetical protein
LDGSEEIYSDEEHGSWIEEHGEDFTDYELIGDEVNEKPTSSVHLNEIYDMVTSTTDSKKVLNTKDQSIMPMKNYSYSDVFTEFNEENHVDSEGYHTINIRRTDAKMIDASKEPDKEKYEKGEPTVETQLDQILNSKQSSSTDKSIVKSEKPKIDIGIGWEKPKTKTGKNSAKKGSRSTISKMDATTSPWVNKKGSHRSSTSLLLILLFTVQVYCIFPV